MNIHGLNLVYDNPEYKRVFSSASQIFCDGYGVVLAAKILGLKGPLFRNTPPDFIESVFQVCELRKMPVFLLGGDQDTIQNVTQKIRKKHPDLIVQGHHGYFDKRVGTVENDAVLKLINDFQPALLIVGMGMPTQELWINSNRDQLKAATVFSVGGLYDFISGNKKRCPQWLSSRGGEWFWRLCLEPQRLWKRYLLGIPLFYFRLLYKMCQQRWDKHLGSLEQNQ